MTEQWIDCDGIGEFVAYPFNEKTVNDYDDYDERRRGESQWKDEE